MMNEILWLITARSGSKSIPDKNIKMLGEYPLMVYRIKSALSISPANNVWVSTDSKDYADIAKKYGATVPFLRPSELASDEASSTDVVMHAIKEAENKGLQFKAIGLLEPTSPFITYQQLLDSSQILLNDNKADGIVAVKESRPNIIFIQKESLYLSELAKKLSKINHHGRQFFEKEITPCGGFYIMKWEKFKISKTFYSSKIRSFLVGPENGLEIDERIDWTYAEFIINKRLIKLSDIYNVK